MRWPSENKVWWVVHCAWAALRMDLATRRLEPSVPVKMTGEGASIEALDVALASRRLGASA